MRWFTILVALVCRASSTNNGKADVPNANHIFNAIHDSMRQFGNSLNHNGMSIFLATIPKDTELYHGTSHAYRINGTDWLAFEPEHAQVFARGPVPPPPEKPDEGKQENNVGDPIVPLLQSSRLQVLLDGGPQSFSPIQFPGYFHTYRTKHDLRLLYVDGQSAAKSSKGTLDVQDYILLSEPPSDAPGEWLPFHDLARARCLCHAARTEWQGKIDGIIRMEAGFEVMLCAFAKHLDVVRISQAKERGNSSMGYVKDDIFDYYKSISARYDGIGGGRVSLNYDSFITVLNHSGAMYYDSGGLPRVDNTSKTITSLRKEVKQLALKKFEPHGTNWQATTDMIVTRYADRIAYMTSGAVTNLSHFQAELDRALRPFIDYSARDSMAEILRCTHQYSTLR